MPKSFLNRWLSENMSQIVEFDGKTVALVDTAGLQAVDDNLLGVSDDVSAVRCWLSRFAQKANTLRAYTKESDRFLLWLSYTKRTIGLLNKPALDEYVAFLQDPKPMSLWCSASNKRVKRGSSEWRPFKQGLTGSTVNASLAAINSLLSFLVDADYINKNPLKLVVKPQTISIDEKALELKERIITVDEWRLILQASKQLPTEVEQRRAKFILLMLFYTGMRVSELAGLTWAHFRRENNGWSLVVRGKGDRVREIAVEELIYEVVAYRRFLSHNSFPSRDDDSFVVPNLKGQGGISEQQIYSIVKRVAAIAAEGEGLSADSVKRLKAFSQHWVRHLCPSLLVAQGVDARYVQQLLGHSTSTTTDIYVHLFDEGRREAVKKLEF